MLSAVELEPFTELGGESMTGEEIGDRLGLHARAIYDFLDTLVALRFLERDGEGAMAGTAILLRPMIKLFQEWQATSWMPANLPDYDQFIKPAELRACLARNGLTEQECVGLAIGAATEALIPVAQAEEGRDLTGRDGSTDAVPPQS